MQEAQHGKTISQESVCMLFFSTFEASDLPSQNLEWMYAVGCSPAFYILMSKNLNQ